MITLIALFAIQGWSELGGSATGSGLSASPDSPSNLPRLAVDGLGRPTVSWMERINDINNLHLRRWNGAAWVELGGSDSGLGISGSTTGIFGSSLALDGAGHPVVVWSMTSPDYTMDIHLKRWNGSAWTGTDGSAATLVHDSSDTALYASVAIDPAGRPVVCWSELGEEGQPVYLKRWDGTSWVALAGSASTGIGSTGTASQPRPALALDSAGRPVVAWPSKPVYATNVWLKRWTGAEWEELGGSATSYGVSGSSTGQAGWPALAVDSSDQPVVAWKMSDFGMGPQVRLRRWNGSGWEELGGSGSGGGVSQTVNLPGDPSLALDGQGKPILAWQEYLEETLQVYLKRWSGTAWEALQGSASGYGINGSAGLSSNPQVAVGASGLIAVCWRETGSASNSDVHLRWRSTAPPALAAPLQFRQDGETPIAPGGVLTVDETGFVAKAASNDPDGPTFRLQVEVRPVGTPFSGIPTGTGLATANGATASVLSGGFTVGESYHWQARALDDSGTPSAWVAFGTADPEEADFSIRSNDGPAASTASQADADSGAGIGAGGQVNGTAGVRLQAVVDDPDGDRVRIEVEVRPAGSAFTGLPTAAGALVDDGGTAWVVVELPAGRYEWHYRGVDEFGAGTAWTAFAPEGFSVAPLGSIGGRFCGAAAPAGAAWPIAWMIGLVAAAWRRGR